MLKIRRPLQTVEHARPREPMIMLIFKLTLLPPTADGAGDGDGGGDDDDGNHDCDN